MLLCSLTKRAAAAQSHKLPLSSRLAAVCSRHTNRVVARDSRTSQPQASSARQQWSPLDSDDFDEADTPPPAEGTTGGARLQEEDQTAGKPGGGLVGLFVAAWMALLSLALQLVSPVFSLSLYAAQPLTRVNPVRARAKVDKWVTQLPQGFWARLHYLWERPVVKSIRITASIANWSVRLPAIAALLLAQGGALASTISFPMLAPLLLGTGMMVNSIKANATLVIPRLGLMVVLLWVLWFFTNVVQTTWVVLCKQGRIDLRTLAGARMMTECTSLLLAGIVVLSMLGINISALLLPAGVVLAIASRELLQNLVAGFFLVLAQPFRLGDKVAVHCSAPADGSAPSAAAAPVSMPSGGTAAAGVAASSSRYEAQPGPARSGGSTSPRDSSSGSGSSATPGWFEGTIEKVDLRYTVLRDGRRRLMVPNTAFVSREFLVYDDGPEAIKPGSMGSSSDSSSNSSWPWHQKGPTGRDQTPAAATAAAGGQPSAGDRSPRGQQPVEQQGRGAVPPEPAIVEGHMTTQFPPLAQPIYPGMSFVTPGYPPFPAMHYQQQPLQGYPFQDPFYGQLQQQQEEAGYAPEDWRQQQQQQQNGQQGHNQQQQEQSQQQGGQPPHPQEGQGGQQEQQQQQPPQRRSRPMAKGPPGYLPQGFAAAPPYMGIPVGTLYYGVPGVVPWPGTAAQPGRAPDAGQQQDMHQPQHQQQHQQQGPQQHGSKSHSGGGSSHAGSESTRSGSQAGAGNLQQQGAAADPAHARGPAGSNGSRAAVGGPSQQQQGPAQHQAPPPPQQQRQQQSATAGSQHIAAPHTSHMAAGAGFGLWGMGPAGAYPGWSPGWEQPGGAVYPPHHMTGQDSMPYMLQDDDHWASRTGMYSSSSSSAGGGSGGAGGGPWQQQQQQQQVMQPSASQQPDAGQMRADARVDGSSAAAGAALGPEHAPAAAADTLQDSNLVLAVLQEITRQQS